MLSAADAKEKKKRKISRKERMGLILAEASINNRGKARGEVLWIFQSRTDEPELIYEINNI